MNRILFKNAKIFQEESGFIKYDIIVEDGKIKDILVPNSYEESDFPKIYDFSNLTILPGFIDIHTHGAMGFDTAGALRKDLEEISSYLVTKGVTAFLPSAATSPEDVLKTTALSIKDCVENGVSGATVLGLHLEGPYFCEKYKGAQNPEYLRKPSISEVLELDAISGGNIRLISIAPELDENFEFIKYIKANTNITLSQGHTQADYNTSILAAEYGATHVTHLFNGMPPMHHRNPSVVGAALDKGLTVELICDGVHISPAIIRIVVNAIGSKKVVVISDAILATGLEDGEYIFAGQKVYVKDARANLADGTIAGSTSNLHQSLINLISFGIDINDAINMCTINPARSIGVGDRKGSIKIGKDADFVVLDEKMNLCHTIIAGEIKFSSK